MMSVFLTEEIEKRQQSLDDTICGYFFCNYQDEKRNTCVTLLRSLLYQILTKRPQLRKHTVTYFESPEKTQQTLSSFETLWIIFRKPR